ncbi:MAG: hypothetical protein Kow00121_58720 [Elainellaceae cyanobacterium]
MQAFGIYTLANDVVYDQLVAFLNSVEANISSDIPVVIIPYDDRLEKVQQEVISRNNVTIFDDQNALQRWEDFAQQVWSVHPQGRQKKSARLVQIRRRAQRRYAAFDGPFEKFVVYDADCLAMKPLDALFAKLETYDFVFDDWEHAKPEPVAALKLAQIEKSSSLKAAEVRPKLHCSSFWGSRRGLFAPQELLELRQKLIEHREVEWINGVAEAFLFSYLTLRSEYTLFNFTLSPDSQDRTGNCADADPFININNVLYNKQGLKPIHRIHYMNYSAESFSRLSQGEDVTMRYKDVFLYYRFMQQPEQMPKQLVAPQKTTGTNHFINKILKRLPLPI